MPVPAEADQRHTLKSILNLYLINAYNLLLPVPAEADQRSVRTCIPINYLIKTLLPLGQPVRWGELPPYRLCTAGQISIYS